MCFYFAILGFDLFEIMSKNSWFVAWVSGLHFLAFCELLVCEAYYSKYLLWYYMVSLAKCIGVLNLDLLSERAMVQILVYRIIRFGMGVSGVTL